MIPMKHQLKCDHSECELLNQCLFKNQKVFEEYLVR